MLSFRPGQTLMHQDQACMPRSGQRHPLPSPTYQDQGPRTLYPLLLAPYQDQGPRILHCSWLALSTGIRVLGPCASARLCMLELGSIPLLPNPTQSNPTPRGAGIRALGPYTISAWTLVQGLEPQGPYAASPRPHWLVFSGQCPPLESLLSACDLHSHPWSFIYV